MTDGHWTPLACWRWGVECAMLDVRDGSVRRAAGDGVWEGIPHTPMFWRGYQQYLEAADRRRFLHYARQFARLAGGASDPGASSTA
jgi:hypothetical protein